MDYLVCHLIQEQGQKKLLNKIKSSLKQTVHVPKDFDSLGSQLILFATASTIFFGKESICTKRLNQLVLLVGRNKKALRDQIALDKFFAARFLFAVDRRVQRWLRMCKAATMTRMSVNNNVLNFDDLLEQVLNGSFHMNLPTSFKKIKIKPKIKAANVSKPAAAAENNGDGKGGRGKKQKGKNRSRNLVKNSAQDKDFKLQTGETWQETYSKQFPQDRPSWDGKVKMYTRWNIKGVCYDNCARFVSHVAKDKIPADKKEIFLTFMSKCRKAAKKSN